IAAAARRRNFDQAGPVETQPAGELERRQGPGEPDPDWPAAAWRTVRQDVSGFLRLVWRTTTKPRQFYAEGADGKCRALNPIAATLNAISVLGALGIVCRAAMSSVAPAAPWWIDFVKPVTIAAYLCLWGGLCHAILRALGARRPLRTT